MIGLCGEPQCLCHQIRTPAPVAVVLKAPAEDPRLMSDSGAPKAPAEPELSKLSDHELRWALRDGISVMYRHLGLELKEEK